MFSLPLLPYPPTFLFSSAVFLLSATDHSIHVLPGTWLPSNRPTSSHAATDTHDFPNPCIAGRGPFPPVSQAPGSLVPLFSVPSGYWSSAMVDLNHVTPGYDSLHSVFVQSDRTRVGPGNPQCLCCFRVVLPLLTSNSFNFFAVPYSRDRR